MNRTRAIDNVAVIPAPTGNTHAAGYFTDGTTVDMETMNGIVESLVVPLEDGSVTPDTDDYTQFAVLLSGVHGILSNIRTTLATVAVSTYAKKAAIAVTNAICSGSISQCNAGDHQTASGAISQCNCGYIQVASGQYSQCNAGDHQTASGAISQCNCGSYQTASGIESQCNAGARQTASNSRSQCNAGRDQFNDGIDSSIIGGAYVENIDNDCITFGKGTGTPPTAETYGDKITNKNIYCKIHCDTGMIDQKELTKTCAVTLDAGGLTPAAVAWADYNDHALISVDCTVTCDASNRTVTHGDYFQFTLPGWAVASNLRQVSEVDVMQPTTAPTPMLWGLQTDSLNSKATVYYAGPTFTVQATETFHVTCQFHRIAKPTSSYSA